MATYSPFKPSSPNSGVDAAFMQFEERKPDYEFSGWTSTTRGPMSFPDPPVFLNIRNASDPTKLARSRIVRAGGVSRLSSVIRVRKAGVYAVSFRVPMDANNRQAMIEAGASPDRRHYWAATSFACVGFPPLNEGVRAALRHDRGLAQEDKGRHGGRAENSLRATITSLPEGIQGTGGKIPIVCDGGFRRGTDIFKAMALGATSSRPAWMLSHAPTSAAVHPSRHSPSTLPPSQGSSPVQPIVRAQ